MATYLRMSRRLERVVGIEPASSAWKAAALPLCYTRAPQRLMVTDLTNGLVMIRRQNVFMRVMVGEAGLEPAKLTQGIYSPPPLPLGTFPQHTQDPSLMYLRKER